MDARNEQPGLSEQAEESEATGAGHAQDQSAESGTLIPEAQCAGSMASTSIQAQRVLVPSKAVQRYLRVGTCDPNISVMSDGPMFPKISAQARIRKGSTDTLTFTCSFEAFERGNEKFLSFGELSATISEPYYFGHMLLGVGQTYIPRDSFPTDSRDSPAIPLRHVRLDSKGNTVTAQRSMFDKTGMQKTHEHNHQALSPKVEGSPSSVGVEVGQVSHDEDAELTNIISASDMVAGTFLDTCPSKGFPSSLGVSTAFSLEAQTHQASSARIRCIRMPQQYVVATGQQSEVGLTRYEVPIMAMVFKKKGKLEAKFSKKKGQEMQVDLGRFSLEATGPVDNLRRPH